jgi:hypothetical protein
VFMGKSKDKLRERLWAAEDAADRELEWFFACANGTVPDEGEAPPAVRKAAATIQGWLAAITTFHAGALSLRYTPREWPKPIRDELGDWSGLVVRLECAAHPSDLRTCTSELEEAAVRRLEHLLARRGEKRELERLVRHAHRHVRDAIRAYVKVRGLGPLVLPGGRRVA